MEEIKRRLEKPRRPRWWGLLSGGEWDSSQRPKCVDTGCELECLAGAVCIPIFARVALRVGTVHPRVHRLAIALADTLALIRDVSAACALARAAAGIADFIPGGDAVDTGSRPSEQSLDLVLESDQGNNERNRDDCDDQSVVGSSTTPFVIDKTLENRFDGRHITSSRSR